MVAKERHFASTAIIAFEKYKYMAFVLQEIRVNDYDGHLQSKKLTNTLLDITLDPCYVKGPSTAQSSVLCIP